MRVGINATCIGTRPSGAKQRFIGLYGALFRQQSGWNFTVYAPVDCAMQDWFEHTSNVQFVSTPLQSSKPLQRFLTGQFYWRRELEKARLDVLEGLHLPLVANSVGATMLTIHDVRGLRGGAKSTARTLYRQVLKQALRRADRVVTVSSAMRKEILLIDPHATVDVVHNGINRKDFDSVHEQLGSRLAAQLDLPSRFLLCVGHFEERKNYGRLLDALKILHEQGESLGLVIVGNDSGQKALLGEKARSLGLEKSVSLLSGLTDDQVAGLYRLCTLFVFPSFYEGFGIPLVEAMAAARPFVTSDLQVFKELSEDQGLYFSPHDPRSIASTIGHVLESPAEQARLMHYGIQRAAHFDFGPLAKKLARSFSLCRQSTRP